MRALDLVGELQSDVAEVFIRILIFGAPADAVNLCRDIVLDAHMEERGLPRMSVMFLLPPDFIVDALLRTQIGCCHLAVIVGIHLGKGRHDKGLADIQINAVLAVELVQPLRRSTEVMIVLPARSTCRPCLAQPEDAGVAFVKPLLPLAEYAPVVARITCIIRTCIRGNIRKSLMHKINSQNGS